VKPIFISVLLCASQCLSAQQKQQYDSLLAKKLNADKYGMHRYVMAILKTGQETQ